VKESESTVQANAQEVADKTRSSAAKGLDAAASMLRDNTTNLGSRDASRYGHAAADGLENTARYIRDHDFNYMASDLTSFIRQNPVPSLVAAAAVGFVVGRILARD
jgi:ElaB/YqjD/DUF883 family membrane-anchored ribosome-binding protein